MAFHVTNNPINRVSDPKSLPLVQNFQKNDCGNPHFQSQAGHVNEKTNNVILPIPSAIALPNYSSNMLGFYSINIPLLAT